MSELEQQLAELKQHIEDNKTIAKKAKKSKLTYKISKTYLLSLLINIPLAFILHSITPSPIIILIISPILSLAIGGISTITKNEYKG